MSTLQNLLAAQLAGVARKTQSARRNMAEDLVINLNFQNKKS